MTKRTTSELEALRAGIASGVLDYNYDEQERILDELIQARREIERLKLGINMAGIMCRAGALTNIELVEASDE